jgi:hypothetical protein
MEALRTAAGGSPVGEGFQAMAVLPGKLEEFPGVKVGGFRAKKSFEAPLDVWTFPGLQAVARGREPVKLEQVPHGRVLSYKL